LSTQTLGIQPCRGCSTTLQASGYGGGPIDPEEQILQLERVIDNAMRNKYQRELVHVGKDGNCFLYALMSQSRRLAGYSSQEIRNDWAAYMQSGLYLEDEAKNLDGGMSIVGTLDPKYSGLEAHVMRMICDTEWVDETFIFGIALLYKLEIVCYSTTQNQWVTIKGGDSEKIVLGCRENQHFYSSKSLSSVTDDSVSSMCAGKEGRLPTTDISAFESSVFRLPSDFEFSEPSKIAAIIGYAAYNGNPIESSFGLPPSASSYELRTCSCLNDCLDAIYSARITSENAPSVPCLLIHLKDKKCTVCFWDLDCPLVEFFSSSNVELLLTKK